jgi:hypothetical protein
MHHSLPLTLLLGLLIALAVPTTLWAQAPDAPSVSSPTAEATAHAVPFATEAGTLELLVVPPEEADLGAATVTVEEAPAWLTVRPETRTLEAVEPGEETLARFTFDVAPTAPVGEAGAVRLAVTAEGAAPRTVAVRLVVEAPTALTLSPNYPNPFNPVTTIAYELPEAQTVRLVVYDVLGRRVATLVEDRQDAGRHEVRFDASPLASGLYVYRLMAGEAVRSGRMLLVK